MRNDERYRPKPQSGQLEIFGLGAKGEADAETGEVYEVITDEARMIGDGE